MFRTENLWCLSGFALLLILCLPHPVLAAGSEPVSRPAQRAVVAPGSAEAEYAMGLEAKAAKRFSEAVPHFRRAVELKPGYPEAWNELGFALRQTGQYPEALRAYDEALRLRPNFPEAMEYLGEAYVKLGRLDDAQAMQVRLKTLDPARAKELEEAIQARK
jgi:Flp pilus assembly protein TadD